MSGKLLWVTSNTRLYIAYDSCVISNYGKTPSAKNLLAANKGIDKLKKGQHKSVFPDLENPDLWKVKVNSDTAHDDLQNGGSQDGFLVNKGSTPIVGTQRSLMV